MILFSPFVSINCQQLLFDAVTLDAVCRFLLIRLAFFVFFRARPSLYSTDNTLVITNMRIDAVKSFRASSMSMPGSDTHPKTNTIFHVYFYGFTNYKQKLNIIFNFFPLAEIRFRLPWSCGV